MSFRVRVLGAGVVLAFSIAVPAAKAGAPVDYASTAQNIIPSGQYGSILPPPAADDQAVMYDGLTPLFDNVTMVTWTTYFKSEAFPGLGTDGPGTVETIPGAPPGLTVTRDAFNVPHIEADTEEKGIWAAGYLTLEDRNVLLGIARYNGRVAALDIPGLSAIGLTAQRKVFRPYPATDEISTSRPRS